MFCWFDPFRVGECPGTFSYKRVIPSGSIVIGGNDVNLYYRFPQDKQ